MVNISHPESVIVSYSSPIVADSRGRQKIGEVTFIAKDDGIYSGEIRFGSGMRAKYHAVVFQGLLKINESDL
jgi:hypothetical protein